MKRGGKCIIGSEEARRIARDFLRQHHSVNRVDEPALKGGFWHVEVTVSIPHSKRIEVMINAETGGIEGFEQK